MILQENSSGFILRSFSSSASLCSLSFLIAFNNFSEGLFITIGSFVYDITQIFDGAKIWIILQCAKYLEGFLLFAVIAHLVKDWWNEWLETGLCLLADGSLWDVRIIFSKTIGNQNGLVVEFRRSICPGSACCRWCRWEEGIAECGDSGSIGIIYQLSHFFLEQCLFVFILRVLIWLVDRNWDYWL